MNDIVRKEGLTEVKVWDWPLRVLHWTNAGLIIFLILSMVGYEILEELGAGKAIRKPIKEIHAYVGHVLAVTLILRIIWGFVGNKYAQWSDIIPYKKERWINAFKNLGWVFGGLKGKPPVEKGHNSLASMLYVPLFAVLIMQVFSGVILSGEEFGTFPGSVLAGKSVETGVAYADDDEKHEKANGAAAVEGEGAKHGHGEESPLVEAMEEVHEVGYGFLLFFIAAHLAGLILHEIGERRGLLSSMISGSKYYEKDEVN
ncbi:MAG: cytochrome b/b6 domain-containing protein [Deltaproteobacteria bacterium]|nr:cytochrome b/b6 domain-containing protein [Deltaproteobacteria bacterium]